MGQSGSLEIASFARSHASFYSNYVYILHCLCDIARWWPEIIDINLSHLYLEPQMGCFCRNFADIFVISKVESYDIVASSYV